MNNFKVAYDLKNLLVQNASVVRHLQSLLLQLRGSRLLTQGLQLSSSVGVVAALAARTVPLLEELAQLSFISPLFSKQRFSWYRPMLSYLSQLVLPMGEFALRAFGAGPRLLAHCP